MKNSQKIASAALAAVLIATGSACGGSSRSSSVGEDSTTTSETTTTTVNTLDDDIENPVDISEFVDTDAEQLENPNLRYIGYYDIRTAADVKPAVKLFEETYGGKIDYEQCTWAERIDKLQVLIASGDSPDICLKEGESFPLLTSKNVYEDLTEYIDLSLPQWAGFEDLINQYEWKGKHVYYPWHASAFTEYIFYSKARFEELGITTPRELYDSNEWDWNTFRDTMKKFIDASGTANEVYGIYGLTLSDALICSTGTPLIGMKNGSLSDNMNSIAVDRAASFLEGLRRDGLTVAMDGYWGDQNTPIVEGKACFLSNGQYHLDDFMKKTPEVEIEFVPFPRDPEADEYYYQSSDFGYLVPSGSQNVKGAAAFINMLRLCKIDPDLRKEVDESNTRGKGWTMEQIEFMKQFEDLENYHVVADFYGGLDGDSSQIMTDMLRNVTFDGEDTWTVLRDTNINVIDASIDAINNG